MIQLKVFTKMCSFYTGKSYKISQCGWKMASCGSGSAVDENLWPGEQAVPEERGSTRQHGWQMLWQSCPGGWSAIHPATRTGLAGQIQGMPGYCKLWGAEKKVRGILSGSQIWLYDLNKYIFLHFDPLVSQLVRNMIIVIKLLLFFFFKYF